jgi:hypothetical protein
MANPPLLICDSDVLVQLFLANELRPLTELKKCYGIQPAIVLEVDTELRWIRRYRDRFVSQVDKLLDSGNLKQLDQGLFQSFLSGAVPGTSWGTFQALGAQYYGHVDIGEAYTFAAGVTLGVPVASNDFSAIETIKARMLTLPVPILRCFDLLAFAYGAGLLELKACNKMRSELLKHREGLPAAFQNASFEDGLMKFAPRLMDGAAPGMSEAAPSYSSRLTITRI